MFEKGKLYLIPTPLGDDTVHTIPTYVIQILHRLDYFIAERAKTARRFIKSTGPERPINVLTVFELNKYDRADGIARFLEPAEAGHDIGVLSEAGCPGVADPGALVVQEAHRRNIEVVPLVGPSSLLLGLMASGMNGQSFTFHGYLPHKPNELSSKLKQLEQLSRKHQQTQLFIETPYRNNNLLEIAVNTLAPTTQFAIAVDLSLPSEKVISQPIQQWQKGKLPDFHKRPAIFLLYAGKQSTLEGLEELLVRFFVLIMPASVDLFLKRCSGLNLPRPGGLFLRNSLQKQQQNPYGFPHTDYAGRRRW